MPRLYLDKVGDLDDEALRFYRDYVRLESREEIVAHIERVRNEAYALHPYPCLGMFSFVDFRLSQHPQYPRVLERLSRAGSQDTLLDLGCCLGQEIRKLIFDGARAELCTGTDLEEDFIQYGYDLFRDRATLKAKLVPGDLFDPDFASQFRASKTILSVGSLLHLFSREKQIELARIIVTFLTPGSDVIIIGQQSGQTVGGLDALDTSSSSSSSSSPPAMQGRGKFKREGTRFTHSPDSFAELWHEANGPDWQVESSLRPLTSLQSNTRLSPEMKDYTFLSFFIRRKS